MTPFLFYWSCFPSQVYYKQSWVLLECALTYKSFYSAVFMEPFSFWKPHKCILRAHSNGTSLNRSEMTRANPVSFILCPALCFSDWCRPISRRALGTFSQARFGALGSYVYQLVCGKWSCFVAIAFLEFNRSGITTSILSHLQVSQCQTCSDNRGILSSKALIW